MSFENYAIGGISYRDPGSKLMPSRHKADSMYLESVSSCCGVPMLWRNPGRCPKCWEHCEYKQAE